MDWRKMDVSCYARQLLKMGYIPFLFDHQEILKFFKLNVRNNAPPGKEKLELSQHNVSPSNELRNTRITSLF